MKTNTNQSKCGVDMQWLFVDVTEKGLMKFLPVFKFARTCRVVQKPHPFISYIKTPHISAIGTCYFSISRKWSRLMDSDHAYIVLPYAIIRYSTDISAYSLINHILLLYSCQIENEGSPDVLFPVRILHFWKQFIVRKVISQMSKEVSCLRMRKMSESLTSWSAICGSIYKWWCCRRGNWKRK